MKRTRGLWLSIAMVALLVVGSLIGFATGALQPTLGLDLEGGVSVILTAPEGTPRDVMDQALTNIRNRVDAFGVGEPDIVLSGNTIEVQIPGLTNGTIEERQKEQYCLIDDAGVNYGCGADQAEAQAALDDLQVTSQASEACVEDADGTQLECFTSEQEATAFQSSITVSPKTAASPSASPSGSASPSASPSSEPDTGGFCLTDPTGKQYGCSTTKKEAQKAADGLTVEVTKRNYCVTGGATATEAEASPTPSATPDPSKSASSSPSASASPSASPSATGVSGLDLQGTETLPCELETKADAQDALDAIAVSKQTVQYCVISSAAQNLGCFIDRDAAEQERRATGQQRLLSVIGQTARLEQRPVLAIVPPSDPTYTSLAVTCPTAEQADTDACSFDTLDQQEVVYMDAQKNKFRLGPTVISGSDITNASAVFGGSGVTQWQVSFELGGDAVDAFAEATTTAVSQPPPQNSIAIVVDRSVISYPTVNDPITNGSGVISGGFDETEAKDLATVLNAGALPVELTRQSVQTVSPTLGEESLRQGIVAGIAGLILLFLYLLFYYRLLGIVAWFGMSAWAILALAIVSIAGAQVGYALTLAGVAGLVISLGVTADSYIVFFERLKDEVRSGKSARSAVQPAFKRSYKTIVAADFVTMIAAVVLYVTAVSSVRGFALTLGVATLLDLFVVYFFKRPTVFLIARNERLVNMHGFGLRSGIAGEPDPDDAPAGGTP